MIAIHNREQRGSTTMLETLEPRDIESASSGCKAPHVYCPSAAGKNV